MGRCTGGCTLVEDAGGLRLVDDDGVLGYQRTEGRRHRLDGELAGWQLRSARLGERHVLGCPEVVGQCFERGDRVVGAGRQRRHSAALGHQRAGLARVGEERGGRGRIDEHHRGGGADLHLGELGQIGQALDDRQPGAAALDAGEDLAEDLGPGRRRDADRRPLAPLVEGAAAEEQHRVAIALQRPGRRRNDLVGNDRRRLGRDRRRRRGRVQPAHVGGQDQRGHATGRTHGLGHRAGPVGGNRSGGHRTVNPGRDRAGDCVDIALERGVVALVVRGMVADDVDHRGMGTTGIVQVGEAVSEAGAQVQQGAGRLAGDAGISVGRSGGDALEEPEHRPHARDVIQRGHEVHLGSARVGEAHLDAGIDQRADQRLGAVGGGAAHRQDLSVLRRPKPARTCVCLENVRTGQAP